MWTRVKLPRHLAEVMLESETLMARYRIAVRDTARDGRFARLPDRSFTQWVRYDLLPRVREVADGRGDPPDESMVATQALRELDGTPNRDRVIDALLELDRLLAPPRATYARFRRGAAPAFSRRRLRFRPG
jgi:hypothetical protein